MAQGDLQLTLVEPQTVIDLEGVHRRSTIGFVPDLGLDVHGGLGRCETGVVGVDFGALAELRCAAVQQGRGAPLSVALSGAAGAAASAGIGFAPAARLGVDVSARFGPIEPLVDLYLTTARQAHYVQTGVVNDPVVAPAGIAFGQQEIRLSVPIGVAFVDRQQKDHEQEAIVGVTLWFTLAAPGRFEVDPLVRVYAMAGWGMSFTLGVAFR